MKQIANQNSSNVIHHQGSRLLGCNPFPGKLMSGFCQSQKVLK